MKITLDISNAQAKRLIETLQSKIGTKPEMRAADAKKRLHDLAFDYCIYADFSIHDLCGKRQLREHVEHRMIFISLALKKGFIKRDIAWFLNKSPSALTGNLKTLICLQRTNRHFNARFEKALKFFRDDN